MKNFTNLYLRLDSTTKTNQKIEALADYFLTVPKKDSIWAISLLIGNRPKRLLRTNELRYWSADLAGIPDWLFDESYSVCGDLAEAISLLIQSKVTSESTISLGELMNEFMEFPNFSDEEKKAHILHYWNTLSHHELYIFNKLITGSFRVGVSRQIVFKGMAAAFNIDEKVIAHRLMGNWYPGEDDLDVLIGADNGTDFIARPYPFCLAYALDLPLEDLGNVEDWQVEQKYDGIRGQIIVRDHQLFIWSRGEDLLTDKFPEFEPLKNLLPSGTVIDGEILPVVNNRIQSFNQMQKRIGLKNVTKKILQEVPLKMICYDLLEWESRDIRNKPLKERRALLTELVNKFDPETSPLKMAPVFTCNSWEELAPLRENAKTEGCEGLMLKLLSSEYETGRKRGRWWKWKVDPYSVDAVLVYAQRGSGRRANLYTDFTFAVWDNETLVPFAKAYSGLTDKELVEVDSWIKRHTIEKFGPVRSVTPELVFEIAFEGINRSTRHKSGIALRFPRIQRWRKDKTMADANTRQDLINLLNVDEAR
jgi:DNA ligase 1